MAHDDSSLERFYDDLSGEYNDAIERCVPRYREMLWALLHYVPNDLAPQNILELGCGSGNLTELLLARYPQAQVSCVDISAEMIERCRQRFAADHRTLERLSFHRADFRDLEFDADAFDLVTSSISLHHVEDSDKRTLFGRIHTWLVSGGSFCFSDQFAGGTDEIYRKHIEEWHTAALKLGATATEWEAWMQHQNDHDHHTPLGDQQEWLARAGFRNVDCPWRYLLWTVICAQSDDIKGTSARLTQNEFARKESTDE